MDGAACTSATKGWRGTVAPRALDAGNVDKTVECAADRVNGYFATIGDANVRARDVAAALGRDTDTASTTHQTGTTPYDHLNVTTSGRVRSL